MTKLMSWKCDVCKQTFQEEEGSTPAILRATPANCTEDSDDSVSHDLCPECEYLMWQFFDMYKHFHMLIKSYDNVDSPADFEDFFKEASKPDVLFEAPKIKKILPTPEGTPHDRR